MKKLFLAVLSLAVISLASCTSINSTMKGANSHVEFYKADFEFSEQVSGTATSTKIVGIDFERLFKVESGAVQEPSVSPIPSLASIPVIGGIIEDPTKGYALYDMMNNNQGYDVVFYPQFVTEVKKPILGIGFIMKTIKVDAKARLAKIK